MTPSAFEAALVLGLIPHTRVPPFYRHLLQALDVATAQQRTVLANAYPGLVVAWIMRSGSSDERALLRSLAQPH